MEENKGSKAIEAKGKIGREIRETKDTAQAAVNLASNIKKGNLIEAAKNAQKLSKSKSFKKRIKRNLMMMCASILIVVIVATTLLSIFGSIVDKMMELASNLGKSARTFWKWIIDDYWIRLDDDIEYTTTDNTRPASYKERNFSR